MKQHLIGTAVVLVFSLPAVAAVKPGPSLSSFNNPVYSCVNNRYVSPNGNDAADGLTVNTAWKTLQHANDSGPTAGTCVNVLPGVYNLSDQFSLNAGGNVSTATGYVVYRSTTLGGAIIKQNVNTSHLIWLRGKDATFPGTNYIMFDGFEMDGGCNGSSCPSGAFRNCFDVANSHHIWLTNNKIHDCGLSGVQLNNSEWYWVQRNEVYNNSYSLQSGRYGSGISVYNPRVLAGYTPTGFDTASNHIKINYNIVHDNRNSQSPCGTGQADGNGIILDDWMNQQSTGVNYTGGGQVVGNLAYHNGGKGIQAFYSTNFLIRNNTAFNNNWDLCNLGTYRGEINVDTSSNAVVSSNIAWTKVGAGVLGSNTPFRGVGGSANVWKYNISYGANNAMVSPNTYPTSTNKANTNPLLVDAPNHNFALQPGSPAIGFGETISYPDSGACDSAYVNCGN